VASRPFIINLLIQKMENYCYIPYQFNWLNDTADHAPLKLVGWFQSQLGPTEDLKKGSLLAVACPDLCLMLKDGTRKSFMHDAAIGLQPVQHSF